MLVLPHHKVVVSVHGLQPCFKRTVIDNDVRLRELSFWVPLAKSQECVAFDAKSLTVAKI